MHRIRSIHIRTLFIVAVALTIFTILGVRKTTKLSFASTSTLPMCHDESRFASSGKTVFVSCGGFF